MCWEPDHPSASLAPRRNLASASLALPCVARTSAHTRSGSVTLHRFDAKHSDHLPNAAESHGDRLAVHTCGSVAAQERDDLRDLARFQNTVLRVDGGALAPHLLDGDAAPFGLRLGRAL